MYERPGDALISLCSGAQHLIIAAPYIKVDALAKVLADISPTASLICVTRWNPHDLAVGASDAECRAFVLERGGSFRLHPSLHAKYYRIDNVVLIGSANLTSAAMGWSLHPNLEILCRAGENFDACAFQQELMRSSREIKDDEFTYWESVAKISAEVKHSVPDAQPLLDTWRPATRDPRHLELVYRERENSIASFDEQRAARRDIQALLIPPALTDAQVRAWVSVCLLAAPFTNTVIQLYDVEASEAYRLLAETHGIGLTEARRDMETVQNWVAFLTPEVLSL